MTTAKQFLANSFWGRALSLNRLRRHAEAVKDWDRVVELSPGEQQPGIRTLRIAERMSAGQVLEAAAEVTELAESSNWGMGQWHTFARVYSVASGVTTEKKQKYADAAVEMLNKAVKAGFKDVAHLRADKDLAPLRGRDDFKKLLADLEAKFPPKREVLPPPRRE